MTFYFYMDYVMLFIQLYLICVFLLITCISSLTLQSRLTGRSKLLSQNRLYSTANKQESTIWIAGEVLIDLVPIIPGKNDDRKAIVGGSGANVAKAATQLGLNSIFLASLSSDKYGIIVTKHLQDNNVNLEYANVCDKSTCLAIVSLDQSGSASYEFQIEGTATFDFNIDWLPSTTLIKDQITFSSTSTVKQPVASLESSRVNHSANIGLDSNSNSNSGPSLLLVGSLVTVIEPAAFELYSWISSLPSNIPVIFDPNIRPAVITDKEYYRNSVEKWVTISSVIKASDEDLHHIYPDIKPEDIENNIIKKWFNSAPRLELIVVTRGEEGITAYTRSGLRRKVPAIKVDVVDTIGAGDTVSAVLCDALVQFGLPDICSNGSCGSSSDSSSVSDGYDDSLLTRVLRRAARAASICCSRAGALPPSSDELSAYPF